MECKVGNGGKRDKVDKAGVDERDGMHLRNGGRDEEVRA